MPLFTAFAFLVASALLGAALTNVDLKLLCGWGANPVWVGHGVCCEQVQCEVKVASPTGMRGTGGVPSK